MNKNNNNWETYKEPKKQKEKKSEEYISLYDFNNGVPMGTNNQVSKDIYTFSKFLNIKIKSRKIKNDRYEGNVILYPKDFLQFFDKYIKPINNEK